MVLCWFLLFVFVPRLQCQLLLVSIPDSCYSGWVVLVLTNSFTIHISAYFNFGVVWDMICWCSIFLWWAFPSLFFFFSRDKIIGSLFSSAAWGFSLPMAGSNMFAKRKDAAQDLFRESNVKLKQFEREKRFSYINHLRVKIISWFTSKFQHKRRKNEVYLCCLIYFCPNVLSL